MAAKTARKLETFADVQARLGHVPEHRIRLAPTPGSATASDLLDESITGGRACELVDGILVEKPMGWREGVLEASLIVLLGNFIREFNLGVLAGADGLVRFNLNLVRMPDISFVSWDRVDDPESLENPDGAFLEIAPDFVVEILSESNTPREMAIKLEEYARTGVRLVWYVDPEKKEVTVYPRGRTRNRKVIGLDGILDGGGVLPGLSLPVARIFEKRSPSRRSPRKGGKK